MPSPPVISKWGRNKGEKSKRKAWTFQNQTGKSFQSKNMLIMYTMLDNMRKEKIKIHSFLLFWRDEQLHLLLQLSNVFFSYYEAPWWPARNCGLTVLLIDPSHTLQSVMLHIYILDSNLFFFPSWNQFCSN